MDKQLDIIIRAKDEASGALKNIANSTKGAQKAFDEFGKNAMKGSQIMLGALTAAAAGAVVFGKSSVDAYFAASQASAKLSTNLTNVRGNTIENVKELEKLAAQLQSVGVIEDDVIKAGMAQLATFNLTSDTIARLTPKITDLIANQKGHNATAEDAVAINNLVGKVMNGATGALTRYGVTLTDNQQELIKNGDEATKVSTIIEALGGNYGDVNKALRATPQGMITALKNDFGDLQEQVGEFIVVGLAPMLRGFSDWVSTVGKAGGFIAYFGRMIDENRGKFIALAGALVATITPALVGIAIHAAPVIGAIITMAAVGATLATMFTNLTEAMGGWDNIMAAIQPAITLITTEAGKLWAQIQSSLIPALRDFYAALGPTLIPALKVIGTILGVVIVGSILILIGAIRAMIAIWVFMANTTAGIIMALRTGFATIVSSVMWMKDNFWLALGSIIGFFATLPIKIPLLVGYAIGRAVMAIISVNWGGVFSGIWRAAQGAFNAVLATAQHTWRSLVNMNWGAVMSGIGRGIGNAVVGMVEGAINGAMRGIPGMRALRLPRFASGVENFKGGAAIVGEKGPEIVTLPKGSNVYPSGTAPAMTYYQYGNVILNSSEAVQEWFKQAGRNTELASMNLTPRHT